MAKPKVIKVTNKRIYLSDGRLDSAEIRRMMDRAMVLLTGAPDPVAAWEMMVDPGDVIGIKPNCLAGKNLSSSPAVAEAMVSGLKSAGLKETDIIIWERSNRELERAGYSLNYAKSGLRCFGTDSRGVGYGSRFHQLGKVASLLSVIFEDYISKNINFPILKDHSVAGISGGMKNLYGLVHNPNKYHPDNCDPFVAEVSALPIVREKNLFTVLDLTRLQYHGGPGYVESYCLRPAGVMVSFDPVAMDAIAHKMLDSLRLQNGLKSLKDAGREPIWLKTAADLGLGQADLAQIDLIEEELR